MQNSKTGVRAPEWLILIGSGCFIIVLSLSAFFEADIRWLHFFQAWMYIATIALALRHNRWGYFIGISAAGFWDYANIFVTTFFVNGLSEISKWIHTGHLARPDQLIAVPAWFSNFFVIIGCLWAYAQLSEKRAGDVARFCLALAMTTAFFATDVALFQPRYLSIFPHALHPHLAWRTRGQLRF